MSWSSTIERFRHHVVPLALFVIVAVTVLIVPPIVLGEVTRDTYTLTAVVLVLAFSSVFPYAVFVAVGTLPLLYAGIASFAAPQTASDAAHSFSTATALRHVVAGISYVLGAAAVGAIGLGAQIGTTDEFTVVPAVLQPSFLTLGGGIVAGAFVCLQLWRYDAPLDTVGRHTILGTVLLGGLLALSPLIAFWIFRGTA